MDISRKPTVSIFSAAVEKLCSQLSAACRFHAAISICFNSREGQGSNMALRGTIVVSLSHTQKKKGGVTFRGE